MKRPLSIVATLVTAAALALGVAPAASAAPACSTPWGSATRTQLESSPSASVSTVRAGRHACFDRLVLDVRGDLDGYHVGYVDVVSEDGSGRAVPVAGGARLVVVATAPAYDEGYRPTFQPRNPSRVVSVSGYRTFRQVAWAGSFEGQTTLALGVRARLPFRAFVVDGPGGTSRLVVDVAHRW